MGGVSFLFPDTPAQADASTFEQIGNSRDGFAIVLGITADSHDEVAQAVAFVMLVFLFHKLKMEYHPPAHPSRDQA